MLELQITAPSVETLVLELGMACLLNAWRDMQLHYLFPNINRLVILNGVNQGGYKLLLTHLAEYFIPHNASLQVRKLLQLT